MQPLFGSVVQTRDALQCEQATNAQCKLVFKSHRRFGYAKEEPLVLVVIVEKCNEEPAGFAVRTNDSALDIFAMLEHLDDFSRRDQSFRYAGQPKKKRKVQSRVHAHQIGPLGRLAANETRDLLLVIIHLAESEEVLFADTKGEFAHRVAKHLCEIRLDELQCVDAKSVHVELGN